MRQIVGQIEMRRVLSYLLLGALLLRVFVPAGFMPTDVGGGWYLEICPDGLTPAAMQVFVGDDHHHHHHNRGDQAESANPVFCDLGAGFASALIDTSLAVTTVVSPSTDFNRSWLEHRQASSTSWRAPARAPPTHRYS